MPNFISKRLRPATPAILSTEASPYVSHVVPVMSAIDEDHRFPRSDTILSADQAAIKPETDPGPNKSGSSDDDSGDSKNQAALRITPEEDRAVRRKIDMVRLRPPIYLL